MATIEERYAKKFARSRQWHEEGKALFAGGVTHQTRFTSPFAIHIDYAAEPDDTGQGDGRWSTRRSGRR